MKQIKTILFAFGCSFLLSGTKAFAQVERLPDEASYFILSCRNWPVSKRLPSC